MPLEIGQLQKTEKLSDRIERILENYESGYICPIGEIAKYFNISEWSIRRQLQDEDTTYSTIRKNVTLKQAKNLLARSQMNINEIARRLGYRDTANFIRFFRTCTGKSPLQFRKGT